MISVIVAFPKPEEAKNIKNVLIRNGFHGAVSCSTGAQVLNQIDGLSHGIVVCGYKFPDMMYSQLKECLPPTFDMLLVASSQLWSECAGEELVCVAMPLKVHELISTLEMMCVNIERKRKHQRKKSRYRSEEERHLLEQAKRLLMDRNNMSEADAHRYLQKTSMDSGSSMVETAQTILGMI